MMPLLLLFLYLTEHWWGLWQFSIIKHITISAVRPRTFHAINNNSEEPPVSFAPNGLLQTYQRASGFQRFLDFGTIDSARMPTAEEADLEYDVPRTSIRALRGDCAPAVNHMVTKQTTTFSQEANALTHTVCEGSARRYSRRPRSGNKPNARKRMNG